MSGTDMDPEPRLPPLGSRFDQWQWTAKLPMLIVGLVMLLAATLVLKGRWRYSVPVAIFLFAAGSLTLVYSDTVHGWCAPRNAAAFGKEWGGGFWHGPSVWDCWHLVNPMEPQRSEQKTAPQGNYIRGRQ